MLYYSQELKKFFNTEAECAEAIDRYNEETAKVKAEKEQKSKERSQRAKEVEEARAKMREAQDAYYEILSAFIKDYGSYHMTETSADSIPLPFRWFSLL